MDDDSKVGVWAMVLATILITTLSVNGAACMEKRRAAIVACVSASQNKSPADCAAAIRE